MRRQPTYMWTRPQTSLALYCSYCFFQPHLHGNKSSHEIHIFHAFKLSNRHVHMYRMPLLRPTSFTTSIQWSEHCCCRWFDPHDRFGIELVCVTKTISKAPFDFFKTTSSRHFCVIITVRLLATGSKT